MTRTIFVVASLLAAPHAFAQGHGGHGDCDPMHAEPVMQTGDFNGNGVIDSGDIEMISDYVDSGDYAAFFDMNHDGQLNGQDVSAVATNMGSAGSARDAQMAELWAATQPYRDITVAIGDGYEAFTPDLQGHGIHFASFGLINSWASRGFQPSAPEGLNYSASGELIAAFYYAPAAIDLYDYGYPVPPDTVFQTLAVPPSFDGIHDHDWHNHVGACFGGASCPVPGFDQCMAEDVCASIGGTLWSAKFHMLHVWMYEFNQCGAFAGIDPDVSHMAPEEPNHGDCNVGDVVPVAYAPDGNVIVGTGFTPNECYP